MADRPHHHEGGALAHVRALRARLPAWTLMQALAVVAAAACAFNAARLLNAQPHTKEPLFPNFDQAMLWLGLALLAALLVAWRPALPRASAGTWPATLAGFWRDHRVEVVLFALILGFGVFMRVFRYGDTLPPPNGLCCEEHINGGVAYLALEGERPVLFPLVRWASAGGFLLFGETTLGLQFFFMVLSIATLVLFYLLLRRLVSVPAALFGLALLAAAWWPALRARQTAEGTVEAVLFALLLAHGLRSRSALALFGAGIVAGLISYEYESYRVVPIIAAGFAGAAAVRQVVLRRPATIDAVRSRALELFRVAWRPALVFLMAAGIVLVPMIVGTAHGKDLYLTSVNRQADTRGGSRLADEWPQQLKWSSKLFLPFGPTDYPTSPPREAPDTHLLDPLTSSVALAGLAGGMVFFLRGYRFWFVSWVVLTIGSGSLLLGEFAPWSFFVLVPVLLVLAAYLVDDVRSFVTRRHGEAGALALAGLLVAGVGFSFWWNADTLFNDVAPSPAIQRVYGGEFSMVYAMCDYLREQDGEGYAYAFSSSPNVGGFAAPRGFTEERAWGDFIWSCHGLRGDALAAPEEAWPLRDLPDGPVTFVFAEPLGPPHELIAELERAYPGLGPPDHDLTGPASTYRILGYEFASGSELATYGLWGDYAETGETANASASRIDPLNDFTWDDAGLLLEPPYTVHWSGVVYVDEPSTLSLRARTDDPVQVLVDGTMTQSTLNGQEREDSLDLLPGWHPVEVTLERQTLGGEVRLAWVDEGGDERDLVAQDLFPLADISGWRHERAFGFEGNERQFVTQRLDFAPHIASTRAARLAATSGEPIVTQERWTGVLHAGLADTYRFDATFLAGTLTLSIDGSPVAVKDTPTNVPGELVASVPLQAGRHEIELSQELAFDVLWSGARLSIATTTGSAAVVRPY